MAITDMWITRSPVMRQIDDSKGHAQLVTFSCSRRRRLLDDDRCKRIVVGTLRAELTKRNRACIGFVVMPDHVPALVSVGLPIGWVEVSE